LGLGGDDIIDARGGADFVSGGTGRDTIYGGYGDDFIFGGPGADVIDSGPDDDFIDGGNDGDTCSGGTGINTIERCAVVSFCTAACCSTNSCVLPPPPTATSCRPPYAQSACLTYGQGKIVSTAGHNWTCSNGNCANVPRSRAAPRAGAAAHGARYGPTTDHASNPARHRLLNSSSLSRLGPGWSQLALSLWRGPPSVSRSHGDVWPECRPPVESTVGLRRISGAVYARVPTL
jgi:hypothetical protein